MKDYVYFIFVLIIALLLTVAKAARCDDYADCRELLGQCNSSVNYFYKQTETQKNVITEQQKYIAALEKKVEAPSILPSYGWVIVGAITGGLLVHGLK